MEEGDKEIKKGVEEARGKERGGKVDRCKIRNETGRRKGKPRWIHLSMIFTQPWQSY